MVHLQINFNISFEETVTQSQFLVQALWETVIHGSGLSFGITINFVRTVNRKDFCFVWALF